MNAETRFDLGLNYGQLLGGALLWTLGGLVVAVLAAVLCHWAGHKLGWFRLKRVDEPRKVLWSVAILGALLCAVIGGWTGFKLGIVRAAVSAVTTAGPRLLHAGIEEGLRAAGLTNAAGVEVKKLHELLDQAGKLELVPPNLPEAEKWRPYIETYRPQIEKIRQELLAGARGILDRHVKGDTFTVPDLVNALMPMLTGELVKWTRGFTQWEIFTGFLWIAGIEGFLALMCFIVRCFSAKPAPGAPSNPLKPVPPEGPPRVPPALPAV
ncbi:MAG: hypothetical protein FJ386_00515 [Verrucomicrobia bacterium]|nr:hypothetical protein [Verrucomicrobiota bacterium]